MVRKTVMVALPQTGSDPNAMAMWGRTRSVAFRDRTKYTRKEKHKSRFGW